MPTLILPSGRVDGHLAQRGHETTGLATRGTDGSNPPPSTGEPTANLSFRVGITSMTVGCEEIRRAGHRHVTVGRTTSAPYADWRRKQRCPPLETAWPMWRFSTGNWRKGAEAGYHDLE